MDGNIVTRKRGKENTYHLNGNEYKAFGSGVPDTISEELNICSTNFQSQHDSPFWFGLTAGQVSRELNSIVDLEIIDVSLASAVSSLNKTRTEVELLEKRVEGTKEEVESLGWVDEAVKSFEELESKFEEREEVEFLFQSLDGEVEKIGELKKSYRECLRLESAVDIVEKSGRDAISSSEACDSLGVFVRRCSELKKSYRECLHLKSAIYRVEQFAGVAISTVEAYNSLCVLLNAANKLKSIRVPDTTGLSVIAKTYTQTFTELSELSELVADIMTMKSEIRMYNDAVQETIQEIEEKSEGVCPVCGRPFEMNKDHGHE